MTALTDSRLVRDSGDLWHAGTTAAFLDAVADGSLPREAFDRWIEQDRLFVAGLTRFACVLAARAPRDAQRVVLRGLASLDDELDWFDRHARERGLDPEAAAHPVCRRYVDHLLALVHTEPVGVLFAAFFGVEASYCHAWGKLSPEGPYEEFIRRWTHPDFVAYVEELMALTDRHPHPAQQAEFDEILRFERQFWEMTWTGA